MKNDPVMMVGTYLGKETGRIRVYNANGIREINNESPLLDCLGWPIIGSNQDGSPIVISMKMYWLGHIGFVPDMYYGATEEDWNGNEWNIRIIAKSINDLFRVCNADDFPIDGCSAGDSHYLIKEIK